MSLHTFFAWKEYSEQEEARMNARFNMSTAVLAYNKNVPVLTLQ